MSAADARRAADIGATAIMVSNHGGRQLDGSRSPFDQISEIVDAVGDKIDVILDGGIRRGTHVLKALGDRGEGVLGWWHLSLCARRRRAARGRKGTQRLAHGDRAGHEVDGGHESLAAHLGHVVFPI